MIFKYVDPITDKQENLILDYPDIDYFYWRTHDYGDDDSIVSKLDNILEELDCTREYNDSRICMTNYGIYRFLLRDYIYYLTKLQNQFTYNEYIDKVIARHIDNLIYEYKHPVIKSKLVKKTRRNTRKNTKSNTWVRIGSTADMYDGHIEYAFYNNKTKETVYNIDPDYDKVLNAKKTKAKPKSKAAGISLDSMTFSFKKK